MRSPILAVAERHEAEKAWRERRARFLEDLKANNDPLVFAQELRRVRRLVRGRLLQPRKTAL
jgi:hypothetical protein